MTRANEIPWGTLITQTRYQGAYEGGEWAAFIGARGPGIPPGAFDSDVECSEWWGNWGQHDAVQVADSLEELIQKVKAVSAFDGRYPRLPWDAYEP